MNESSQPPPTANDLLKMTLFSDKCSVLRFWKLYDGLHVCMKENMIKHNVTRNINKIFWMLIHSFYSLHWVLVDIDWDLKRNMKKTWELEKSSKWGGKWITKSKYIIWELKFQWFFLNFWFIWPYGENCRGNNYSPPDMVSPFG